MKKMETEKSKILVIGIEQCRQSVVENLKSKIFEIPFDINVYNKVRYESD